MAQINKPELHFNTKLYTGNGSTNAITGVGFQPDFTWIKKRDGGTTQHQLFDAVRGVTKRLFSDSTEEESTSATTLTAFGADGFTVGSNTGVNDNSQNHVSWNWKANGAGSANSDGTISTSVSANTTSGFSIMTYTGTGSAGTIGHGLGAKPDAWFVKARSEVRAWYGWHKSMPLGDVWNLNSDGNKSTDTSLFTSSAPTTSVINLGTSVGTNNNGITFVCYAFAEKKGFSKFGSYTGNGNADGKFVYTGFKPAFVMIKHLGSSNWTINDTGRDPTNVNNLRLFPNQNVAESSGSNSMDMLSNGFKLRSTDGGNNGSGDSYNYFAFAEEPLVGTNNVPGVAR